MKLWKEHTVAARCVASDKVYGKIIAEDQLAPLEKFFYDDDPAIN